MQQCLGGEKISSVSAFNLHLPIEDSCELQIETHPSGHAGDKGGPRLRKVLENLRSQGVETRLISNSVSLESSRCPTDPKGQKTLISSL